MGVSHTGVCWKELAVWFASLLVVVVAHGPASASAQVPVFYEVTTNSDSGYGSLRQAIINSNTNAGPNIIILSNLTGTITLLSALPSFRNLTLIGPGPRQLTIDYNPSVDRRYWAPAITVDASATLEISGLSLLHGGIRNTGTFLIKECEIRDASVGPLPIGVWTWYGGAIFNAGNLVICASTFVANATYGAPTDPPTLPCTTGGGGALYNNSGSVKITNSTFSGNSAGGCSRGDGGGAGGAIANVHGALVVVNCTFADNSALGGVSMYGDATLINTILADREHPGVTLAGNNLFAESPSLAGLGPLQHNGGSTLTYALLNASPAIEQGTTVGAPSSDQRGIQRPQGPRTDIGAVEFERPANSFGLFVGPQGPGRVMHDPVGSFFAPNTLVTVTAMADEDYALAGWAGDAIGRSNPLVVRMDADKSIIGSFVFAPTTVTNNPGMTNYVTNTNAWGPGSLRQAVRDANASGGAKIYFSNTTGTVTLASSLPTITANTLFRGPGTNLLTIQCNGKIPGLRFISGVTSAISGLTIANGYSTNADGGGGIANEGCLDLSNVRIIGCRADYNGGGILNSGDLRMASCSILQSSCGGQVGVGGGGIYNSGCLRIFDSVVAFCGGSGIHSSSGSVTIASTLIHANGAGAGGGIYVGSGAVSLVNSTVSSNGASGAQGSSSLYVAGPGGDAHGAGLFLAAGVLAITNCAFIYNTGIGGRAGSGLPPIRFGAGGGEGAGGGLFLAGGSAKLVNCTISGNQVRGGDSTDGNPLFGPSDLPGAQGLGGGLYVGSAALALINCTVTGNHTFGGDFPRPGLGRGGGIYVNLGIVNLLNTILAGNYGATDGSSGISDGSGLFNDLGYNLIGGDPRLGPLQDNGGPTLTHALLSGSPAIDAGTNTGLLSDQRGQPRTVDNPAIPNSLGGDGTDIGALEVDPILRMTEATKLDSNILVRFTSVSDKSYGLQYKSDVTSRGWTNLAIAVRGSGGIVTATNNGTGLLPSGFYRAFELPPP